MPKIWKGPNSLFWLIPITYGLAATAALCTVFVRPEIVANRSLFFFVAPFCVVAPFGGWWAIYQCIRYEENPWRYVAVVFFVPLGFVWYYVERYRVPKRRFWRDRKENKDAANP